jgi:hypothetical protein
MIVPRLRVWLRLVIAMIAMLALLLTSSVAGAQGPRPSLLDSGVGAAMYGRCQADLLTGDMRRATVILGAFAPDAVGRVVTDGDELAAIAKMCAQQIHQQRCSEKIVALAGDVLTSGRPGEKASPPPGNPGAIMGGTIGVLGGLMFGDRPIRDAALYGIGGAAGGGIAWDAYMAKSCRERQVKLDGISLKLRGTVSVLSTPALEALIRSNAGSSISSADADTLIIEANKLSVHMIEVLQSLR